ncbi:GGDEF domain-containing protein [Acidothermaceae bacterium B102]|nr:GGDEF domain-containing protein [Acidothermaceae bacterium B102]
MPPARLGGLLVCAGAVVSLVLSLTNSAYSNGKPLLTVVPSLIALLFGMACVVAGARTPRWALELVPGVAGALIIVSMWATDTPLDGSQLLFVWCTFFAGYFLRTLPAVVTTVAIAVGYTVMLVDLRGLAAGAPSAVYLSTTLAVACFLVLTLRRRATAALEEARTEARTDPLTGLLNRRGLGEMLSREVERAEREGRPLSAWVIDLDHFKSLNDALGHAVGDIALVAVAEVLRGELRGLDVVARTGGEEFCVVLPDCTTADAFLRAESVREAVAAELAVRGLPVTLSIGIATWQTGDVDGDVMLTAADEALYAAKAAGRNQSQVSHGVPRSRLSTAEAR